MSINYARIAIAAPWTYNYIYQNTAHDDAAAMVTQNQINFWFGFGVFEMRIDLFSVNQIQIVHKTLCNPINDEKKEITQLAFVSFSELFPKIKNSPLVESMNSIRHSKEISTFQFFFFLVLNFCFVLFFFVNLCFVLNSLSKKQRSQNHSHTRLIIQKYILKFW